MAKTTKLVVVIGEMDWISSSSNQEKPCMRCQAPTRGRMKMNSRNVPACCGCALTSAIDEGLARATCLVDVTNTAGATGGGKH